MGTESLEDLRQREQAAYKQLEERAPEKLIRQKNLDPQEALAAIGITGLGERPKGFLRFLHQDFIVEEVRPDGISTIEHGDSPRNLVKENPTVYADLVKIGLGTAEAISDLAHAASTSAQQIGYAGMKDSRAITSQLISIRGAQFDKLLDLPQKQFFVKLKSTGKGAIAPGQLQGNRFTIFIRTQTPLVNEEVTALVENLVQNGFPNFYGIQRFGPRLLNPLLGKLLCQGKYDEAIRTYLVQTGPNDIPIYSIIRKKAALAYPDWSKMKQTFDILPYTFRHERFLLDGLTQHPSMPSKALYAIQDQVRFWAYGYVSYLINRLLSKAYAGAVDIPDPLPLPLGDTWADELYREDLTQDQIEDYRQHLRPLAFLQQKSRTLDPWIIPAVHKIVTTSVGAVLSFTLPKGVYATTFLMFLFNMYEGSPVPDWVKPDEIDTKELLGIGSVKAALNYLASPPQKQEKEDPTEN